MALVALLILGWISSAAGDIFDGEFSVRVLEGDEGGDVRTANGKFLAELAAEEYVAEGIWNKKKDVLVLRTTFNRSFGTPESGGIAEWYARLIVIRMKANGQVTARNALLHDGDFMKKQRMTIMSIKSISDDGGTITARVGINGAEHVHYSEQRIRLEPPEILK
jgi:hypothetical protein